MIMKKILKFIIAIFIISATGSNAGILKLNLSPGYSYYNMTDMKQFQESMASKYLFKSAFLGNFPEFWSMGGALEYYYEIGVGMSLGYFSESTGSKSSYVDYSGEYYDKYKLKSNNFSFGLIFDSRFAGIDWKYFKTYLQINVGYKNTSLIKEEYWQMLGSDTLTIGEYSAGSGFVEPQLRIGIPFHKFEIGLSLGYHSDLAGKYERISTNKVKPKKEEFLFDDKNNLIISSEWSGIRIRANITIYIIKLFERPDRTEFD